MNMQTVRYLVRSMIRPLEARIKATASRAVIRVVEDSLKAQGVRVTLLADEEPPDAVEHVQPFGLRARPPVGSEAVYLTLGGDRSHGVVFGAHKRGVSPQDMSEGETALYSSEGVGVFLDEAGLTNLGARAPENFVALANLVLAELNDIRTKHDLHTHPVPGITAGTASTNSSVPAALMGAAGSVAATNTRAE